jgi:tRNA pseudouridine55 synthase
MNDPFSTDSGILLIDKPSGITSHDVVNKVRRKTGIKRVGHAGTLDPLATGLLILLVGRDATRRQTEFLKLDKEYECTAQIGIVTDTYDVDGKILHKSTVQEINAIKKEDIEGILESFKGEIEQTVPAYSAVKIQGKKLYDLARKGAADDVELPIRKVNIYKLELNRFWQDEVTSGKFFKITVHCSSGTYIRSLVHDIGKQLEVGATVVALRRTKIGTMSVENAVRL